MLQIYHIHGAFPGRRENGRLSELINFTDYKYFLMNNPEGSLTSLGAAGLRAAHQLLDGEPKLFSDPVILRLLDPGHIEEIKAGASQFQHPETLRLRSRIALRSRYAEDRLMLAYSRGVRQYLLLGAGLDTFAWRQPEGLDGLKIFEADHHATQEQKRQRLSRAGLSIPANCQVIAINFEDRKSVV